MSDHGMSFPFSKATAYFNGTWSPVILKYPGMPAAAVHEEFVSSVDLMPTLLDLLVVKHPAGMDGRSWLPLLRGGKQDARDFVITHVNTVSSGMSLPQRCIRTKEWALLFHAWSDGTAKFRVEAMSGITYKALEAAGQKDERIAARVKQLRVGEPQMFFNEITDRAERNNLIYEPSCRPEIERLAKLLLAHMEKTEDPQTANFKKALAAWRSKVAKGP
jgi:N-sulfoglucosamine sulfohydrolase